MELSSFNLVDMAKHEMDDFSFRAGKFFHSLEKFLIRDLCKIEGVVSFWGLHDGSFFLKFSVVSNLIARFLESKFRGFPEEKVPSGRGFKALLQRHALILRGENNFPKNHRKSGKRMQ